MTNIDFFPTALASMLLHDSRYLRGFFALGMTLIEIHFGLADQPPQPLNYQQHVRPIFVEHCASCHNLQKKRAGLALDDYAAMMVGGASGEVIVPGDPTGSRLWNLVSHEEEPTMPPDVDRIAESKLDIIRKWIESGAVESAGDKPAATKASALVFDAVDNLTAECVMPQRPVRQPLQNAHRPAAVASIACAPAAPLVAITQPDQVLLYHLQTAELLAVIPCVAHTPEQVRFSRDGHYLIVAGGHHGQRGQVLVWDVALCRPLAIVGDELDVARSADLHPGNQAIALGGPQRLLRVYDLPDGERRLQMDQHTDWIQSVIYQPQGKILASGDRAGNMFLWEAGTGRQIRPLAAHAAAVTDMDWRDDGQVLASCSEDGTIRIWESSTAKQLRTAAAHEGGTTVVRYLHDGRLVSAGRDKMVRLWSSELQPLAAFGPMPDVVLSVDAAADQSLLVAGDWQGNILSWKTEPPGDGPQFSLQPPSLQQRLAQQQRLLQSQTMERDQVAVARDQLRGALQEATTAYESALTTAKQTGQELDQLVAVASNDPQVVDNTNPTVEVPSAESAVAEIQQRAVQAAEQIGELTARRAALTTQLLGVETQFQAAQQAWEATTQQKQLVEQELLDFGQRQQALEEAVASAQRQLQADESRLAMIEKVKMRFQDVQNTVDTAIQDAIQDEPLAAQVKAFRNRTAQALADYEQQIQIARQQIESSRQFLSSARLELQLFVKAYSSPVAQQVP